MSTRKTSGYSLSAIHNKLSGLNRYYWILLLMAYFLFLFLAGMFKSITLKSDSFITVNVTAKIPKNDVFYLYYLPKSETLFSDKFSVNLNVTANKNFQTLSFQLPDSFDVKQLRLDLGYDRQMKEVEIQSFFLEYNDEKLVLLNTKAGINQFTPNEFVGMKESGTYLLATGDQNNYDPFIYTNDISNEYGKLKTTKATFPFPNLVAFCFACALFLYALLFKADLQLKVYIDGAASCLFIALLFLPVFTENMDLFAETNLEKRTLAQKPDFKTVNLSEFPKQYEAYFTDHFKFKAAFAKLNGTIRYRLFNASSVPSKAMVGLEDWFFLSGSFYKVTEDLARKNLYTESNLKTEAERFAANLLQLSKDSIIYAKAVWPDKHYIYAEYLPKQMRVLVKDTISRCNQFINYVQGHQPECHIVDVREKLLEAKKKIRVYDKYDSHWNSFGAFIGYTELMKELQKSDPQLKPLPMSYFNIQWEQRGGGDLSDVMGLNLSEFKPQFSLKNDQSKIVIVKNDNLPEKSLCIRNENATTNHKALIFRDSFTSALIPFLNLHFKEIIYLWDVPFSIEEVKKYDPDVVIECYATRYFR